MVMPRVPKKKSSLLDRLGEAGRRAFEFHKNDATTLHSVVSRYGMRPMLLDPWPRQLVVKQVVADLRERQKQHPFDAIAFMGLSGAVLAPIVANELEVGLIAVRKKGDRCHIYRDWEGVCDQRYLILDDDLSSGNSARRIISAIGNAACWVGAYWYAHIYPRQLYVGSRVALRKAVAAAHWFDNAGIRIPGREFTGGHR